MKLGKYMERESLDDEAMAKKIRSPKIKCDRTMVSRFRRELRRPDWPMINRIATVTSNEVTADDWMSLVAAE